MEGYHFQNWARTYECHPQKYFEPDNVDELRSILRSAKEQGKKIRIVGYGHSPSDLCCTDDWLIRMCNLNHVLKIDEEKKTVLAGGGLLLKDLVDALKAKNLALSVLPTRGEFTLAGLVSTCTHGSGVSYPVLADFVISLSLLTTDDQILTCSRDENSDLFHAVCGGLGTLGVITMLELQCEDYYNLKHIHYPMSFDDFVESVDELCQESDHFKATYFPYTDRVIVSSITRSKVVPRKRSLSIYQRFIDWFRNVFILKYVIELGFFLATFAPFMVKYVNRLAYHLVFSDVSYEADGYERVFFFDCLFHQYVSEWAVRRSRCADAIRILKTTVENRQIPAHFTVEIRFIRRDSFWLSPAYERDVCAINLISFCPYDKTADHAEYWKVAAEIMRSFDARPNLAKDHSMTSEEMSKAYPRFDDFLKLRRRMDPENVFVNDYIERTFGNVEEF